jgi:polysaccharide export outer membrane protein
MLWLVSLLPGCASSDRFRAGSLPREWQAVRADNAQTVELARLASPTIQNDLIGRGDLLEVRISAGLSGDEELMRTVRVSDDGTVYLSELGQVPLEGLELESAESVIASLCQEKDLYRSPQVTVAMKQPKLNLVTVIGAVKEPKTYSLRSGSSNLLTALVHAGGLADDAGTQVEIMHPGYRDSGQAPAIAGLPPGTPGSDVTLASNEVVIHPTGARSVKVDLVSASRYGNGGYYLPDGSVVTVERRDPLPLHVLGLVNKPDQYDFPIGKELKLLDAVALAGGVSNPLADKVYIIRTRPGQPQPALIEASVRRAKNERGLDNPVLSPGDVVSVEQTPATVAFETIRLIGFGVTGRAF